ncbi:MAG: transglutaminase-like domain-containing protein, partial [Proteobacteria bacterium]|nr:transglutaminase-like domain-containing protein [Pseudomonadota bacterium]
RLVEFVYQYIEDDYSANPLTVLDIIATKKGDCSEHAALFTALARASGIPCRTVGGLIYLGDASQEFGLHAWNEVVIDGVWVPADPTWGQTLIDATHLRFPLKLSEEWQIMASIPKMKLTVLQVERKE